LFLSSISYLIKDTFCVFFDRCDRTENSLGVIKATLKQFTVYLPDRTENIVCKLYRTDEGNWYDLTDNNSTNSFLLTSIKIAIDESEQEITLLRNHI